jgi:hypothetical protein
MMVGQSHETSRQPPLASVSELINQLGSLLASETDLASDTPVEVLVGRQRYAAHRPSLTTTAEQ